MNDGPWTDRGYRANYDLPDRPPEAVARDVQRDLAQLRQSLADNPDLAKEVADLAREIQRANIGATQGAELDDRLKRQVLPSIEQLELLLRRKVDEQRAGNIRSGTPDVVPPGYADAVAEYFRKLSKGKQ